MTQVSTGGLLESTVAELEELARKIQRERVEERKLPARVGDVPRRRDMWLSGYLAGIAAGISKLTGESALLIEARIVSEVGRP